VAASGDCKRELLNGFVNATGYSRKHAIALLGRMEAVKRPKKPRKRIYDESVKGALIQLWMAGNQICSKRLVPFLPALIEAMERFGRLALTAEQKGKLLSLSPATADRLLKPEKQRLGGGKSTTKPGSILRNQIPIRTFSEWNDVVPGFFEGDLVAHCGGNIRGRYCHTLTLTDIVTTWTECAALPAKTDDCVITAVERIEKHLPFPVLGLDTDNGSEFINYELADWCTERGVTFTRARAYRKNDQAHVEEKNGSVVRRLTGYERFEGDSAYAALSALYDVSRLYINFFQPSVKLLRKRREGGKVRKVYDTAKTPYQRVLESPQVDAKSKEKLSGDYQTLDPVWLLAEIAKRQENLWHTPNMQFGADALEHTSSEGSSQTAITPERPIKASRRGRKKKRNVEKPPKAEQPRKKLTGTLTEYQGLTDTEIANILTERVSKHLPF
jgi:hypothetical protein